MNYINYRPIKYFFPCFILTMAFSMVNISSILVGTIFGWITLGLACFISVKFMKSKKIMIGLISLMIGSRIISLQFQPFYFLYEIINFVLFFIVGLILFNHYNEIIRKQLTLIIIFCAPIMFLQLAGVKWVNYHTYGQELAFSYGFANTLFTSSPGISHAQIRPAGILWSNQPLGLLIMFSVALIVFHYKKLNWITYFLISLVIVFSTSKYVYFSYLLIIIIGFIISNKVIRKRLLYFVLTLPEAVFVFMICFPGISNRVLSTTIDSLYVSIYVRLFDMQSAGINFEKISPFTNVIDTVEINRANYVRGFLAGYTGEPFLLISMLYKNQILMYILLFILTYIFVKFLKTSRSNDKLSYSRIFSLLCLIIYIIINPRPDPSLIAFFSSFPLSFLFQKYLNRLNKLKKNSIEKRNLIAEIK